MNFQKYFIIISVLSLNSALFSVTKNIQNEVEFNKLLKSKRPQVVKFYANWCSACQQIKPHFDKVAQDPNNFKADFATVEIDKKDAKGQEVFKNILSKYKIEGLPTIVFFKNGQEETRLRGCPANSQCEVVISQYIDRILGKEPKPIQQPAQNKTNQKNKK